MRRARFTDVILGSVAAALLFAGVAGAAPRSGARYVGTGMELGSGPAPLGLAAPKGGQPLPGPGLDDADPSITYNGNWVPLIATKALEGTYHRSRKVGNTVEVPIQSNRVTVYFLTGRRGGRLDVYLDTVSLATRIGSINQASSYRPASWALELTGLDDTTPHTLILRHRKGGQVTFDAVTYRDASVDVPVDGAAAFNVQPFPYWPAEFDQYLAYDGLWNVWSGRKSVSYRVGDTVTFTFTGDAFTLYLPTNPADDSLGRLRVFIDGQRAFKNSLIDQQGRRRGNLWVYWANLPYGAHTVKVKHVAGKTVQIFGFNAYDLTLP